MTTKLTLTVDDSVIKKAKVYAKSSGRSLSELVENYLDTLTGENSDKNQISQKLRKIAGAVKLPAGFDEDTALKAYYENKHL